MKNLVNYAGLMSLIIATVIFGLVTYDYIINDHEPSRYVVVLVIVLLFNARKYIDSND